MHLPSGPARICDWARCHRNTSNSGRRFGAGTAVAYAGAETNQKDEPANGHFRPPSAFCMKLHELIPPGTGVVTLMTQRWACVGGRAQRVFREGNAARLAALGVTFRGAGPAIAAPPYHGSPRFTRRRRRCRALARGDSIAWLNAQLASERAVIPLAARTINRDAVSGRESSSALTLKDTCAETVNVSVTDGLASDTSVTTALTRNTTRPGIQGGRQDLAAGAPGRLRYLTVTSNVRGAVVLTGRRRFPMELRAQNDLRDIAVERSVTLNCIY